MKRIQLIQTCFLFCVILFSGIAQVQAQLPDGSIAPNFTLTDIDGNSHTLYDYLDAGTPVVLHFGVTWGAPGFSYHQSNALQQLYDDHGPNATNEVMVLFIESDDNTDLADLNGTGLTTVGDFVTGTNFPIIDDGEATAVDFGIAFYPTIYTICPTRELTQTGQIDYAAHLAFVQQCASVSTTGCQDMTACNYNVNATVSGTCVYASGCDSCSGETDGTGTVLIGGGDTEAPMIICQSEPIVVTALSGEATATVLVPQATATDNCSAVSLGSGLNFDNNVNSSEDDQIALSNAPALPQYTLETWFRTDDNLNDYLTIYSNFYLPGGNAYGFWIQGGRLNPWTAGGVILGSAMVNDGAWHHLALTYDGVTLKGYVDGVLDISSPNTNAGLIGGQFRIGLEETAPIYPLRSTLDEFRIWDSAKTQAEIMAGMNGSLSGSEPGLTLYYPFDDGAACVDNSGVSMVIDASGNGYDGMMNNFTLTDTGDGTVCNSNFVEGAVLGNPVTIVNDFNGTADASGVYSIGTTTVTWTATDAAGNSSQCTTTVIVNAFCQDSDNDGVCDADEVDGCTDTSACNFDPMATEEDASCLYTVDECGNCGGSATSGCIDSTACNYDSAASCDDGSCDYPGACDTCSGETDGTGTVIENDADGDGVCDNDEIEGCQDPTACNYDVNATDPVSTASWNVAYSAGTYGTLDIGQTAFNEAFQNSGTFIIRRLCADCVASHQEIYYKRLTNPESFEPYSYMISDWFDTNNVLNIDFELYSSFSDLENEVNGWTSCNYNDAQVGFPRDCGPNGLVAGQWNGPQGGQQNYQFEIYFGESCQYATENCETCSGETDGTGVVVLNDADGDDICDGDEVPGCMDVMACNYNSLATENDNSCAYTLDDCGNCGGTATSGCVDTMACNYDSNASCDDNSCIYPGACDACSGETDGTGTVVTGGGDTEAPMITCAADVSVANDPGQCGADVVLTPPVVVDNCDVGSIQELILNPGFEDHGLASGCYTNQPASFVTANINNVTAFYGGTANGIDVGVDAFCYADGSNSGSTHIVMAGLSGANMFESISFDLAAPIVSGQTYDLTFYARNSNPTGAESLSIGISSSSTSFGTQAVVVPLTTNTFYTQYSATFVAPVDGDYLTVEPDVLANFWFGLDDFSLMGEVAGGTASNDAPATYPVGTTTVTWSATDLSGNTATCEQLVTVTDTELPVAVCNPITIEVSELGNTVITGMDVDGGSTDNCAVTGLSVSPDTFTYGDIGTQMVTLTVTDAAGNTSQCTTTVTVDCVDTDNDGVCDADEIDGCTDSSACNFDPLATEEDASCLYGVDECGNCGGTATSGCMDATACNYDSAASCDDGSCDYPGACDACSGETDGTGVVILGAGDLESPTAFCNNISVELDATGNYTLTQADIDAIGAGSTDNCSDAADLTFSVDQNSFNCMDISTSGSTNYALDFDGSSDRVSVNNGSSMLAGANQFTMEGWVYPRNSAPNFPDFDCFMGWRNESTCDFFINQLSPTLIEARFKNGSGNSFEIFAEGLTLNEWQHLALTYDGASINLYRNGVLLGTSAATGSFTADPSIPFYIGHSQFSSFAYTLDGQVDEVRIWNVAKSAAELQSASNICLAGDENNLVGYYPLEDGPGSTTVTDLSVNGNHGDLINMDAATDWVTTVPAIACSSEGVEVTLTVTDEANNSSTCSAIIEVEDNLAPTAICAPITIEVSEVGNTVITAMDVDGGSTDNCTIESLSVSPDTFTYGDIGTQMVTLTVTDAAGNTSQCTTTVTVDCVDTDNDGVCDADEIDGCTDSSACNFDPLATEEDASCLYGVDECGNCGGTSTTGCVDTMACNYDSSASCDDGSCEYLSCAGCTESTAANYDSTATIDDGSCIIFGCTYDAACNYNPIATDEDGTCEFNSCIVLGCTYAEATNYDSNATDDDMSCVFDCSDSCQFDFTDDGLVNTQDLLLFLGAFGTSCN